MNIVKTHQIIRDHRQQGRAPSVRTFPVQKGMHIINYHNVVGDKDYDGYDRKIFTRISEHDFAMDVEYLHARHVFVGLDEMVESLRNGRNIPNALAFTFDDAYAGVLCNALPTLEAFGARGCLFVISDYPSNENKKYFDFDKLEIAFRLSQKERVNFSSIGIGIDLVILDTIEQKTDCLRKIKAELKRIPQDIAKIKVGEIQALLEVSDLKINEYAQAHKKYLPMTWDQIRLASGGGHFIGSHTMTHPSLTKVPLDVAAREINSSLSAIREHVPGLTWIPFAYPYGKAQDHSRQISRIVMTAGHPCALTTICGGNVPGENLFSLRRVELENGRFI